MAADPAAPCRLLAWDSAFFERRIAALNLPRLTPESMGEALAWCDAERIDCLYFLADFDDPVTTALAHASGFLFVDVRVTLELKLPPHPSSPPLRTNEVRQGEEGENAGTTPALSVFVGLTRGDSAGVAPTRTPSEQLPEWGGSHREQVLSPLPQGERQGVRAYSHADLTTLKAIARVSYTDSRFYFDPHFPREKCDLLYERWIEKSCAGGAERVIVAEQGGEAVGYITCHLKGDVGEIGLLGVSQAARGGGVGGGLIRAALDWFREQGAARVSVVTQGRNVGAQRAYGRAGFLTRAVQVWYHRWFER